jgi:hypothetical protein
MASSYTVPLILGLTTVALAWGGDAISQDASKQLVDRNAVPASSLAQVACDGAPSRPAQVLSLRGPAGEPAQLVRVSGVGWKYSGKATSVDGDAALQKMSPISTPMRSPLSVFIDGPTGYTFIYIQDAGWKFVGTLESADNASRTENQCEPSDSED